MCGAQELTNVGLCLVFACGGDGGEYRLVEILHK